MIALKIYLLTGLVAHKVLWEVMKRRLQSNLQARSPVRLTIVLIKLVKLVILVGLVIQIMLPDVFPIMEEALLLRGTGLVVFTLGLGLAITARIQLGESWSDIEEGRVTIEQGVRSDGVYRYIKHPIYVGDLLLLIGLELCLNSWLVMGVIVLVPVVLAQAIREEIKLTETLPGYATYASQTKRFIPFIL